jgi:hypothetical protein
LIRNAVVFHSEGSWGVTFTTRALSAIESLLSERVKTHRWLHYQAKVVAFKNAFSYCVNSRGLDPLDFRADKYVSETSYLDDGWLLARLGELTGNEGVAVEWARNAILRRTNSARSLWKRPDEFRVISREVAKGTRSLEKANEELPVLNHLWKDLRALDEALNEHATDVRFLVYSTKMKPFTATTYGRDSEQQILERSTMNPVLLTEESKLVDSLRAVVNADPWFGVTVVGEPGRIRSGHDEFVSSFREAARTILTTA